ncbi:MAG: Gfo/Idh/MocA family protein [Planctomycetota bacterium]
MAGKSQASSGSSRRGFLGAGLTGVATVAGGFVPVFAWTQPAFANRATNDRPRIGCIGTGSMGTGDARDHARFGDIVAVCDVDNRNAERCRNDEGSGKCRADAYRDYRRVLDRPDVDVVSIVTPDHWHVKIALEALQAGKHVFCQKPLSLTLEENRLARAAAERHPNLQFFIGTQQRSDRDLFLRAVNMVHQGLLGDVKQVTVGINGSPTGGPFEVAAPPKELDWEMWLGQAPLVDYREKRCHYEFRWWYEYSGGKFTDWGAHHVDIAQWALKEDVQGRGPVRIDGTDAKHPVPFKDGFPTVDDCYNTSHDFAVTCTFPGGTEMVVTSRGDNGILFEGTKGRIFVNREKITGKPIEEGWDKDRFTEADVVKLYKGKPFEDHKANFYRCIREGGLPVSDVFSHVMAMSTCHLTAIAARLGRAITWDPAAERITGDEQAAALAARTPRAGYEIPRG